MVSQVWPPHAALPPGRKGFSLLEMVVVIGTLQILMALIAGTLWAMVRIERKAGSDFQRTLVQGALADQFRSDVAAAVAAPNQSDGGAAGPRCLILRTPDGGEVVYRWDIERLERAVTAGTRTWRQYLPLGVEEGVVEFARADDGRVIILRLTEWHGEKSLRRQRLVEISAALGGDRR
jgi:hypothetical protein